MDAADIIVALTRIFNHSQTGRYHVNNVYFFDHGWGESDFLTFSRSGLVHEVEIKISRADFRADFAKSKHHAMASGDWFISRGGETYGEIEPQYRPLIHAEMGPNYWPRCTRIQALRLSGTFVAPNRFSFAMPAALAEKVYDEVPAYAGLYAIPDHGMPTMIRKAPVLHKTVHNFTARLLDKYWWNHSRRTNDLHIALHRAATLLTDNKSLNAFIELRGLTDDFRDFERDYNPPKK